MRRYARRTLSCLLTAALAAAVSLAPLFAERAHAQSRDAWQTPTHADRGALAAEFAALFWRSTDDKTRWLPEVVGRWR